MIILYGIANCDTIKKARRWLDAHRIELLFAQGSATQKQRDDTAATAERNTAMLAAAAQVRAWVDALGWEALLNRRGTTWRKLSPALQDGIDQESAIRLMLEQPSIIRRPLLDIGPSSSPISSPLLSQTPLVGFSEATYAELFG